MEDYIAENADEEKKSRKVADKVNKVADAANELSEELHRKVTVEELVAETGLSRKAVEDAIRISGDRIEAIDTAGKE
jgi:RNA polymerase primary sigma factor